MVLGLLFIAGGWWLGFGRYTEAPTLLQLTKDNAVAEAARLGFTVDYGPGIFSEEVPADTVMQQSPAPGGRIVKGGAVTLFLSVGPERYPVPNVAGQSLDYALSRMPKQFVVEQVDGHSDTLPKDYVAGTDPPAGTQLKPGSVVKIIVVRAAFPVHVPDVVGKLLSDAEAQLRAAGFTQIEVQQKEEQKPKDTVLEMTPPGGTGLASAANQKVVLVVSKGPALPMPNVGTQPCQMAASQLQALGLQVDVQGDEIGKAAGTVKQQNPPPDTPLTPGQQVQITCQFP